MSSARCDGPTDRTERHPVLEPFDALIGTWATEGTHPLLDAVVAGSTTFEWLGRPLPRPALPRRARAVPDAISVIGAPEAGDGLVMEYFDSRGVRRTYGVSLDDGVLRIWRDDPAFAQRFSATLGHDAFEGRCGDGTVWWVPEGFNELWSGLPKARHTRGGSECRRPREPSRLRANSSRTAGAVASAGLALTPACRPSAHAHR